MLENTPTEASAEETKLKKKHAPHHRASAKKTTGASSPRTFNAEELNRSLSTIYRDADGAIPDMKKMNIKKTNSLFTIITWLLGLTLAGVMLAWAGFFWLSPGGSGNDELVKISLAGPTELTLNATSTYTITFQNNGTAPLRNVTFSLYYPKGFIYATSTPALKNTLHNEYARAVIAPGESGKIVITGKNYGAPGEQKSWRGFMNYTPDNFNSELQKAATLTTTLAASGVALSVSGPDKAIAGTEVAYSFIVNYARDFILPFELALVAPPNFVITSSTPAFTKNNIWNVLPEKNTAALNGDSSAIQFTLRGKFTENKDTPTPLKGVVTLPIGNDRLEIARAELAPEIIKNDLDFNVAINGSLTDFSSTLDDMLTITLHLKNTSADTLKNAVVNLVIDGPSAKRQSLLKWTEIVDQADGDVQGQQLDDTTRRGTITWNSKKIPALAKVKPNDEITIDLRLPIKDAKTFDPAAIKTPVIAISGNLAFVNQNDASESVSSKPIIITLNSNLKFENRDTVEKNSTGQDVHTIAWVLTNSFHPLKNITLTAVAYGDISVVTSSPSAGTLSYDPGTKQIAWAIAEMPESVDVLNSSFVLTLLKNNPTQNTLLSKVHLLADDEVTKQKIDLAGNEIAINEETPTP